MKLIFDGACDSFVFDERPAFHAFPAVEPLSVYTQKKPAATYIVGKSTVEGGGVAPGLWAICWEERNKPMDIPVAMALVRARYGHLLTPDTK